MTQIYYLRNPNTAIVSHSKQYLLIRPGTEPALLEVEEGAALDALLQRAVQPVSRATLRQFSSEESIDLLVQWGALIEGSQEQLSSFLAGSPSLLKACKHLVLGVSGSISASAVLPIALQLTKGFCERLDVIFTKASQKFIKPEVFQFRGIEVWSDAFQPRGKTHVPHVHLASSAEMVLILPASANTIFKLANGVCSDLLSLVVAASSAPLVVAPVMNQLMRAKPSISRNINTLRADGAYIIEPAFGVAASKGASGGPVELGAMGVNEANIVTTLEAILLAHRALAKEAPLDEA